MAACHSSRARSIVTLDGYMSRGKAPPSSVPRDYAILQDFSAYLELRLKCQNMAMLRRIFADFLNEQENTLVPMMQQGCTIVTIYPVLRISAKSRRQADILLSKPKCHLDARDCVFLYLQHRTATRNMALFKHFFLEFLGQREAALLAFVERGCQVISVIPFELPRQVQPAPSSRAVGVSTEQQQVAPESAAKRRRKRRDTVKAATPRRAAASVPDVSTGADGAALSAVVKRARRTLRKVVLTGERPAPERRKRRADSEEPEMEAKRRRTSGRIVSTSEPSASEVPPASSPVDVSTPKRGSDPESRAVPPASSHVAKSTPLHGGYPEASTAPPTSRPAAKSATNRDRDRGVETSTVLSASRSAAKSTPKRGNDQEVTTAPPASQPAGKSTPKRRSDQRACATPPASIPIPKRGSELETSTMPLQDSASAAATEVVASVLAEVLSRVCGDSPKRKRDRKSEAVTPNPSEVSKEKSHKRGKPAMTKEMCRSQVELARKMETFEAQMPWEAVYGELPAPFDEEKHPAVALKFRTFWRKHSRAVWERKLWAPVSRKLNLLDFNRRNNRQLAAKSAFESLLICAYETFGAAFFVQLDSQKPRHPGWWYRGPVVALFALQQLKGEDAMWDYVSENLLRRFPNCNLALPLAASNSGAMRIRHERESASMWMTNHPLTPRILREMAAVKAESQSRALQEDEAQATTVEPNCEPETAMADAVESCLL